MEVHIIVRLNVPDSTDDDEMAELVRVAEEALEHHIVPEDMQIIGYGWENPPVVHLMAGVLDDLQEEFPGYSPEQLKQEGLARVLDAYLVENGIIGYTDGILNLVRSIG